MGQKKSILRSHDFERSHLNRALSFVALALSLPLTACGPGLVGDRVGSPRSPGGSGFFGAESKAAMEDSKNCRSGDSSQTCLALKYVVFEDSDGIPAVNEGVVLSGVAAINRIWSQCNIHFQVDRFLKINPKKYELSFNSSENHDLEQIRKIFMDSSTLLVVTTGKWDRSGSLGNTGANAWASMPGDQFYGVVLEAPVGDYPNIIAHELGHYLNLDHASDVDQLMNPVIYDRSKSLTRSECNMAYNAVQDYWKSMVR